MYVLESLERLKISENFLYTYWEKVQCIGNLCTPKTEEVICRGSSDIAGCYG